MQRDCNIIKMIEKVRHTASPCSGKDGGPPFGGLKTSSTNSRARATHSGAALFACFSSSFPVAVLWKPSLYKSLLTRSKRSAVCIVATNISDDGSFASCLNKC
jgi:hypothetical protein